MDNLDILRKLFDEKIVTILNMFLDNAQESFSLTQISENSGVNNATTLRILNKLIDQNIVELKTVGKSKVYRLKPSQKTLLLNAMIKKESHISDFVDAIINLKGVEKIILESRTKEAAKLILITSSVLSDKIDSLAKAINTKYGYKITFIEINQDKFAEMEKFGFELSEKIIWERGKEN